MLKNCLMVLLGAVAFCGAAMADELTMKNGSVLIGTLIQAEDGHVVFDTPYSGEIKIKGENIETGYSRKWPEEVHDLDHYRELAETAGFTILEVDQKADWFRIVLQKPGLEPAERESAE